MFPAPGILLSQPGQHSVIKPVFRPPSVTIALLRLRSPRDVINENLSVRPSINPPHMHSAGRDETCTAWLMGQCDDCGIEWEEGKGAIGGS